MTVLRMIGRALVTTAVAVAILDVIALMFVVLVRLLDAFDVSADRAAPTPQPRRSPRPS
jgi:hypothetical protein